MENKPEFDGRFFVKIHSDSLDRQRFTTEPEEDRKWIVSAATGLYKIDDTTIDNTTIDEIYNYNQTQIDSGVPRSTTSTTYTKSQWDDLLLFGTSNAPRGRWFVDKASFASIVPNGENRYFSIDPDFGYYVSTQNIPNTITKVNHNTNTIDWNSSDITSFQNWGVDEINHQLATDPHDTCDLNINFSAVTWTDVDTFFGTEMSDDDRLADINDYNLPITWQTDPTLFNHDIGDGKSNGLIGMKGVWATATKKYIDIAYSKLGPDSEGTTHCAGSGRNEFYNVNWGVGSNNAATSSETAIVSNLSFNKRFKLRGSSAIYKIKSVIKRRLFNFQGVKTSYIPRSNKYFAGDDEDRYYWHENHVEQQKLMGLAQNRRHSYRIEYELDSVSSPNGWNPNYAISDAPQYSDITNLADPTISDHVVATIEFLEEYSDEVNKISKNPAIFETEPKEDVDLELYYEASSSIPINFLLTNENKLDYIPIGSTLIQPVNFDSFEEGIFVTGWNEFDEEIDVNILPVDPYVFPTVTLSAPISTANRQAFKDQGFFSFLKDDGTIVVSSSGFFAKANNLPPAAIQAINSSEVSIENTGLVGLSWHNCWSFGNGVESNRIGDTYNKPFLGNGATLSSITEEDFKEEHRKNGLIYSGLYNSNSGVNNLNQFIQAEKITKEINPTYGSIQKLHSRGSADGDLIALCEDRVLKILANKDALFNADGNPQLISSSNVLGQAIPYSGNYGISKNPESFASESYRAYFADKVRGSIVRLSKDGLTAISDHGMKDWFRDKLKFAAKIVGSYDARQDEYNISTSSTNATIYPNYTVTFREDVKGWVSFKSFLPENAISCANEYYTFSEGNLWKHHDETVDRNTFYNNFTPTSLNVIINDVPSIIKTFHALNYEGSQSNVNAVTNYDVYDVTSWNGTFDTDTGLPVYTAITGNEFDMNYYNLEDKTGWYAQSIVTNLEEGSINEFIEKEGKWFNYIKGKK